MMIRGSLDVEAGFFGRATGATTTACTTGATVVTVTVGGSMYVRSSQIFGMGLKEGWDPSRVFLLRVRRGLSWRNLVWGTCSRGGLDLDRLGLVTTTLVDLGVESRRVVVGFAEGEVVGAPGDRLGELGEPAGQDQRFFFEEVEEPDLLEVPKEDEVDDVLELLELLTEDEAMLDPAGDTGALWLRRNPNLAVELTLNAAKRSVADCTTLSEGRSVGREYDL